MGDKKKGGKRGNWEATSSSFHSPNLGGQLGDGPKVQRTVVHDPYPFPSIDQLVNGSSGHDLLSFMDAYSRYNKIRMHPMDEIKIAFVTNEGSFYYKRLMDQIFKDQIGLDLEVYIDDKVAKSVDGE
ncbi:hypothetical protein CR513_21430, partial [Mucuna pruriens]